MLYGIFEVVSGTFPTTDRLFLIRGDVIAGSVLLEIQDLQDDCYFEEDPCTLFGYRLFAESESIRGNTMSGKTIYFDELDLSDTGRFSLTRERAVYTKPTD